jgi:hypothetical protein
MVAFNVSMACRPVHPAAFSRRVAAVLCAGGLSLLAASGSFADGPVFQKTPSSVSLQFDDIESGAPLPALPVWVESFEMVGADPPEQEPVLAEPSWEDPSETDLLAGDPPAVAPGDPAPYRDLQIFLGMPPVQEPDDTGVTVQLREAEPDISFGRETWTVARLQLRPGALPGEFLFIRILFDDAPGRQPVVIARSPLGGILYRSVPLGSATGLPNSEGLVVPAKNAASVEIAVPGDGANLRGLFVSASRAVPSVRTVDFGGGEAAADPFTAPAPAASEPAGEGDIALYGRVLASLDPGPVTLSPVAGETVVYEFDLAEPPQAAMVTFELLNADAAKPPAVAINGADAGPASVALPDLADPAFDAYQFNASPGVQLRYAGWIRAQKFIPGTLLRTGPNRITVRSDDPSSGVAVREVNLQLRYP